MGQAEGSTHTIKPDGKYLHSAGSHPGLDKKAGRAMQIGRIIHHNGVALACLYLFDRINRHDSAEFFARLEIGDKLEKGHPILTLRDLVKAQNMNIKLTLCG